MLAFEISVNGKLLYTIGAEGGDIGLLSACVRWMKITRNESSLESLGVKGSAILDAGFTPRLWPAKDLKVGDEITVKIIETDSSDPPLHEAKPSNEPSPWSPFDNRYSN